MHKHTYSQHNFICAQYTHILTHTHFVSNTVGADYRNIVEVVTFEPSDDQISQETCVPLAVIDDLIANEANEQFSVVLIDVTPTINIGNNETCVTIIDDDREYTPVINSTKA